MKTLGRVCITGAVLFSLSGIANTADGPMWEGTYVGIDGGWGFDGESKLKFPRDGGAARVFGPGSGNAARSFSHSPEGGAWGLHLGENRRFGNLVVGLEGSFNWANVDAAKHNAFIDITTGPTTHKTSLNWLATLTPRVGYAMGNWLPYVKAGLAVAEYENAFTGADPVVRRFKRDHIHNGWTAGLGVEYALSSTATGSWILGAEYNYYNFGSRTYGGLGVPDNTWPVQYSHNPSSQMIMARLSYNFGARPKQSGSSSSAGSGWEGIYAGIDAVWGFDGKAKLKFSPDGGALNTFAPQATGGSVGTSPEGSALGLHLGENRQFGNWVVGLEGSFNWANIDDTRHNGFGSLIPSPTAHKTSQNWLGALTPRVGYAMGNWLPYVKAGLAVAEYENSLTGASGRQFKRDHIHAGWTAGLGVEYALSSTAAGSWILGAEYNYYSFDSRTYAGLSVPDNTWTVQYKLSPTLQTVGARLSYKF